MVLEDLLPAFARTKSPSYVGFYIPAPWERRSQAAAVESPFKAMILRHLCWDEGLVEAYTVMAPVIPVITHLLHVWYIYLQNWVNF